MLLHKVFKGLASQILIFIKITILLVIFFLVKVDEIIKALTVNAVVSIHCRRCLYESTISSCMSGVMIKAGKLMQMA